MDLSLIISRTGIEWMVVKDYRKCFPDRSIGYLVRVVVESQHWISSLCENSDAPTAILNHYPHNFEPLGVAEKLRYQMRTRCLLAIIGKSLR